MAESGAVCDSHDMTDRLVGGATWEDQADRLPSYCVSPHDCATASLVLCIKLYCDVQGWQRFCGKIVIAETPFSCRGAHRRPPSDSSIVTNGEFKDGILRKRVLPSAICGNHNCHIVS